jgi:hypothetical protein
MHTMNAPSHVFDGHAGPFGSGALAHPGWARAVRGGGGAPLKTLLVYGVLLLAVLLPPRQEPRPAGPPPPPPTPPPPQPLERTWPLALLEPLPPAFCAAPAFCVARGLTVALCAALSALLLLAAALSCRAPRQTRRLREELRGLQAHALAQHRLIADLSSSQARLARALDAANLRVAQLVFAMLCDERR